MGPPLSDNTLDQPLPTPLAPHLSTLVRFQQHCHTLCQLLFTHLATALQTPPDWFTSRHDQSLGPSGTVFRMLYYPATDSVEGTEDLRAGAHSDFGSLTLLFQLPGQPGLEIKTPEGHWASVPVDPSSGNTGTDPKKPLPILVNIGDLLEDVSVSLIRRCPYPNNPPSPPSRPFEISQLITPLHHATVDLQPPQIHPTPRHLSLHRPDRRQISRPLLASLLLPSPRRRLA